MVARRSEGRGTGGSAFSLAATGVLGSTALSARPVAAFFMFSGNGGQHVSVHVSCGAVSAAPAVYRVPMDSLWAAIIGAIAGAIFGALAAVGTTTWVTRAQLRAQARFRAEANLRSIFHSIKARLAIERRANYPTIATHIGPFDINHREQLAIEVLRNTPDLPKRSADSIRSGLIRLLGEEAVLYCDARAYLPDGDVDIPSEHAAKSKALIPKAMAGTLQPGRIPEIGKRWGDDRERAFDEAIKGVDDLIALLEMGHRHRWGLRQGRTS